VGLLFPGDTGCTLSGYHQHNDNVAPRFGFAYAPDWGQLISGGKAKKFVIRGGFGVYFNRTNSELGLQQLFAPPFAIFSVGAAAVGGSPGFANPYADIAGGPSAPSPYPFAGVAKGSSIDFSQFYPLDLSVTNPNFTDAYAMNYNLNIQRELAGNMILQVGYVGAQGRHLQLVYEGNPISPAGAAACAADPSCVSSRALQHLFYPSHAMYAPGDIFASVGTQGSMGVSSYNSLQVQLQKRLSHGLMFQASYTWAHSIDDTSGYEGSGAASGLGRGIDPFNFALDRGDSNFDARHRFVVNYTYELPIPKWNNAFGKYVLDGWRVGGITTLQTGFPIIVGDTGFRSLTCDALEYYTCWDTPSVTGYPGIYDPRNATLVNATKGGTTAKPYYYFNPNAFGLEQIGTIGNEGRNNFHGPGLNETDLVLAKDIRFTEQRRIEVRLEAFNVFNHTQFAFTSPSVGLNFTDINSGNFARTLTTQASGSPPQIVGRVVQLGAKIYF